MRKDVAPRNMLLDRRVVERNITKGLVTREEYSQWLSSLPDVSGNAETIRAKLGEPEEPSLDSYDDVEEDNLDEG